MDGTCMACGKPAPLWAIHCQACLTRFAAIEKAIEAHRDAAVALAERVGLDKHRECPACGALNGTGHSWNCECVAVDASKAALDAAKKGGRNGLQD